MPRARRSCDEPLALAIASGKTLQQAAEIAGIGERTAQRRMADPQFRQLVNRIRGELIGRAVGQLSDAMAEAVTTLRDLLRAESYHVRLGACKAILDGALKGNELIDLMHRVEALEARQEKEGPQRAKTT